MTSSTRTGSCRNPFQCIAGGGGSERQSSFNKGRSYDNRAIKNSLDYDDDNDDQQIHKGSEAIRKHMETVFPPSPKSKSENKIKSNSIRLQRNSGSEDSPNSVLMMTTEASRESQIFQIYEDLQISAEQLKKERRKSVKQQPAKMKIHLNNSPTLKSRSSRSKQVEVSPPSSDKWGSSPNTNNNDDGEDDDGANMMQDNTMNSSQVFDFSLVDFASFDQGFEVTDQDFLNISSKKLDTNSTNRSIPPSHRSSEIKQKSNRNNVVQPLHMNVRNSKWQDDPSLQDDDILELQSQQPYTGPDQWDDTGSLEYNEIQQNVYLLKPGDYNNDNSPIQRTKKNYNAQPPNDHLYTYDNDICTVMEESAKIVKQRHTSPPKTLQNLRTTQNKSLLEADNKNNFESARNNKNPDRTYPKSYSLKDFRSSTRIRGSGPTLAAASTRSDGYFSNTPIVPDADLSSIPSLLGYESKLLIQDPAYRHAQQAGFLWQSMVGQHVRFPSSWWNGARSPPMGVDNVETAKWTYYGRHTIRRHPILNQLIRSRASAGRLLLHIIVQDVITHQAIQDIAVGCFHPNARGVRKTDRAQRDVEESREVWVATRKRTINNKYTSSMDRLFAKQSSWGEDGITKSPLGPDVRVTNTNMRAVFGDTPPLETIFVMESELFDRLTDRSGSINTTVPLPLLILQEFVFAE